jgi:beta-N-acetylhexosaminidase
MKPLNDALEALGELFIMGLSGFEVSPETSEFMTQAKIGGIILFSHNYDTPAQLVELSSQIQEHKRKLPLWIAVDQEGGKVQRFKKGFTRIPEAGLIGSAGSPQLAFEIAEVIARELRAIGVNLNFCPIADIATNPKNPVIGNRSFGQNEEIVSKMVTSFIRGHLVHSVQPCVKHFPGHGDTSTDSHYALPRIDNPIEVLEKRELIPFKKAFRSKCAMVMTAHILNSKLDPKWPATLSRFILQNILREQLHYRGVIVSDDMEMKAIADHFGATEAPRLALIAGCDMLIYRSEAAARIAYEALKKALIDGTLPQERVLEAASRIRALKENILIPYQAPSIADVGRRVGSAENQAIIHRLEEYLQGTKKEANAYR